MRVRGTVHCVQILTLVCAAPNLTVVVDIIVIFCAAVRL